ncbi:YitT family protein [Frateuria aurantia]
MNAAIPDLPKHRHTTLEDIQALLLGTLLVASGVFLFHQDHLLTGGTVGASVLLSYATPLSFGLAFFILNLPFYYFAYRQMGAAFTLKTFASIALVSLYSHLLPMVLQIQSLNPIFASILGGTLAGVGCLMLFRHGASLGGFNIAALYCQSRYGISAGKLLLGFDLCVMLAGLWVVPPSAVLISVLSVVVMNLIITMNHRNGRYNGVS